MDEPFWDDEPYEPEDEYWDFDPYPMKIYASVKKRKAKASIIRMSKWRNQRLLG